MGLPDTSTKVTSKVTSEQHGSGGDSSNRISSPIPVDEAAVETSSIQGLTRSLSQMSSTRRVEYKVYKRRFFGLVQLVLLNIVVSWSWITFAPISTTASQYFDISESAINWLSTAFFFAFILATPFTFYVLAKHGPTMSILVASILLLGGNWIRYGGARSKTFPVVMLGQLILGLSQPFVLSAPTTYSNLWFTAAGRTSATAVASLANPLGAALGQLISPLWATDPSQVPNTVLYVAIIASVASIPSFFIPPAPPTPPAPSRSAQLDRNDAASLRTDLVTMFSSVEFYLIFVAFSAFVGAFNSFSSLLNQILAPYGFSEDDAGIAGALLIFVGLLSAAISSPLIDKYQCHLWYIKIAVPIIGLCYLLLIWAPQTQSLAFICVLCAINGAASFGLVPIVLEFVVEIHYPLGPEISSSICWCGGQFLGGIFIIIMDQLKSHADGPPGGRPDGDMYRGLIFQAVMTLVATPLPLCLGLFGRHEQVRRRRWEVEARARSSPVDYTADDDSRGGSHESSGRYVDHVE